MENILINYKFPLNIDKILWLHYREDKSQPLST